MGLLAHPTDVFNDHTANGVCVGHAGEMNMRLQHMYQTFQLVSLLRWPECSKNLSGDPNDLFCMTYVYIHFL